MRVVAIKALRPNAFVTGLVLPSAPPKLYGPTLIIPSHLHATGPRPRLSILQH